MRIKQQVRDGMESWVGLTVRQTFDLFLREEQIGACANDKFEPPISGS